MQSTFDEAWTLKKPPFQRFSFPWEGKSLDGYFFPVPNGGARAPVVYGFQGADSMNAFGAADGGYGAYWERGMSFCAIDEPGRGTTFKIYLPEAAEGQWAAAGRESRQPASVGSETILLVEDEESVRKFAGALLRRHGYRVLEAASGEEALAVVSSGELVDLVLTDVVMPGLTGPEMMARLRSDRVVRGLYMSGYTERVLRDGILQSQSELIEKPFGPTELLRRVRQVLDGPLVPAGAGAGARPS